MGTTRKDALTDVAQNLPAMPQRPADKPDGTVVTSSGERITLGEKPGDTSAVSSPQGGMNRGVETK